MKQIYPNSYEQHMQDTNKANNFLKHNIYVHAHANTQAYVSPFLYLKINSNDIKYFPRGYEGILYTR